MQIPPVPSPEELMARFQNRPASEAFEPLVAYYLTPALAVARQILTDRTLAEDAVQEAFLRIIRKYRQYDPSGSFSCWFYTILHRVCVDMMRRRARHHQALQELARRDQPATKQNDPCEVLDLLKTLPPGEREVLRLHVVQGLKFREIAPALEISEEAAKKRAQRGLRRLRETLDKKTLMCVTRGELPTNL